MENRYRVKINELYNGDKEYIPQVGLPIKIFWGLIPLYHKWENIISKSWPVDTYADKNTYFHTATTKIEYHDDYSTCLEVIKRYKEYIHKESGKEVKNITFKNF
jgi:hypothetical protein